VQCLPVAFLPADAVFAISQESPDRRGKYLYTPETKDSYGFFRSKKFVLYSSTETLDFYFIFCWVNWI
jgi:hypothetical protein